MSSCSKCLTCLLIVLGLLAAPAFGQDVDDRQQLRVLSYNIHHGRGMDGVFDYDRLAKIINDLKPDLVALQEVDHGVARSGRVDQAAILAKLTGMHYAFGNALYHQGGEYGEAVLSRYPIKRFRAHHLPFHPGLEPRTALAVQVDPGPGLPELIFVGTHLCHQRDETRAEQTTRLHTLFSSGETPVIMAGDFNARPGSDPMNVLLEDGWVDAIAPESRIDYVLHRKQDSWFVAEVKILDEPVASDHDPVLAVLEWRGPVPTRADEDGDHHDPVTTPGVLDSALFHSTFDVPMNGSVEGLGSVGGAHRQEPGLAPRQIDVDPDVFRPDRDFSVQFWVRTTAGDDQRFVLVSQKTCFDNSLESQKNPGWVFIMSGGTLAWNMGSGSRRITYERDNGEFLQLNDGRWHQLTMTHDADAGLVRLYYDGRNAAIYNVRDGGEFDFTNAAALTIGWHGPETNLVPEDVLPTITHGSEELQDLVDAFNALGLPSLESDELMRLVVEPDRLFASKRNALDPEADADLLQSLESVDLDGIEQITRRLMRNPYTIHQAPSFMEVSPLLKIYELVDGRIVIDHNVAATFAARERLDAPQFDLDDLSVWTRSLSAQEIRNSFKKHFSPSEPVLRKTVDTLTAGVWNIYHGGIHHTIEEHGWDSREAIIDLIRREGIDILMMQETYSSGDYIAAELGYYFATTIDWDYLNQGANISVLSRYPIEEVTVPPGSTFMNVAAKIRLSETQQVYAMSNWYGMRNFPEVFEFHRERFDDADVVPVLFAGDFNAVPHTDGGESPASRRLLEAGFTDAFRSLHPDGGVDPGVTHRSGRRIDQMYFKGRVLKNTSTTVFSQWPSLFPSDHYLIKSVFELDTAASDARE